MACKEREVFLLCWRTFAELKWIPPPMVVAKETTVEQEQTTTVVSVHER
jgi:hypothetical protein